MASLRRLVNMYRDELREGIAHVVFWKIGRSWHAEAFWLNTATDKFEVEDTDRIEEILAQDPYAIIVNGYYNCPFTSCDENGHCSDVEFMMDHIKFRYENSITHRLLYFYERTKPEEVAAEKKEEAASEDKAAIVKALLRALQMTRLGITDMTYRCDKCNSEIVFVTFADGSKKLINVTADSGTQLIRDIVERIS